MDNIDNKITFIHKKNLIHNYKTIKKRVEKSKVMAVIKGDAYGHGILKCSKILKNNGC